MTLVYATNVDRAVSLKDTGGSMRKPSESTSTTHAFTPSSTCWESTPPVPIDDDSTYADDNEEEELETISSARHQPLEKIVLPTIRRQPIAPEMTVEAQDMCYFTFFLEEMGFIASDFKELFPTYIRDSFTYSVDNNALRHSVLAASAVIVDKRQNKDLTRFHYHRQQTYYYLREQLSKGQYDAPLTAAIFWTQFMDLIYGDFDAALKHNTGLNLVLQHLLNQEELFRGGTLPAIPPLCMIMWLHGIRSDIAMSSWLNGMDLSFPPIPREQEYLHRGWMEDCARISIKDHAIEWAAASFALECHLHRACHEANRFIKHRVDGTFTPAIHAEFEAVKQELLAQHDEWWDRAVIQRAYVNEFYRTMPPDYDDTSQGQFLDYPRAPPVHNLLFVSLRNFWYANYIYISLFNYTPDIDRPHDPRRIEYAVEICRVCAVTGFHNFPRWDYWCIIFAAVAFGGSEMYEKESTWIRDRLMLRNGVGRSWEIIPQMYKRMGELWGKQYFSWDNLSEVCE